VIVARGASAALAIAGRRTPVGAPRGRPLAGPARTTLVVTWHPGNIVRTTDSRAQAAVRTALADDLRLAAGLGG